VLACARSEKKRMHARIAIGLIDRAMRDLNLAIRVTDNDEIPCDFDCFSSKGRVHTQRTLVNI
jgi:hypothetical protein